MPNISALVGLFSQDITTALVLAGLATGTPISVLAASNTTPIELTLASPFPFALPSAHVVVKGVLGNTAANHLFKDGVTNDSWVAVDVDATHIQLFNIDASSGALVPSVGNGTYAGGGTVSWAFADGRALLGQQHVAEGSAPPRVVFVPTDSDWTVRDAATSRPTTGVPRSAEQLRQAQQRSIRTEVVTFRVHVWGQATPPDPDADFDVTQVLYQQVVRSAQSLADGQFDLTPGTWTDQAPGTTQLVKLGHEFVFGLTLQTPVLDLPLLSYVPKPITITNTFALQTAGATGPQSL